MQRVITTPAALAPAALTELKDWLGITTSTDDQQLSLLLRASLDLCEQFTGLMPLEQGCEELLPASSDWQRLSTRPVQAITSVTGIPAEGARFTLPVAAYAIELDAAGHGLISVRNPGAAGRIAVTYTGGLAQTWEGLSASLRHGVVRLAAHQYRCREDMNGGATTPPAAIAALWSPWRSPRLT